MQQKANILLVDDSPSKLLAMSAALADLDQCVITAETGRDALRQLTGRDFAVILLDVNMPEMDGFEIAALIRSRKHSAHTPIIFITAYGDDAHAAQGYSLGAVDYLLAPIVPEVLRAKVSVFVELYHKTRQIQAQAEQRVTFAQEHAARCSAESANRIKDEFLATLSHELRTPLNAVLGWVQLLKMGKLDADAAAEGLNVIERNAKLQARIIEDLLDVSRIISGKLKLETRPTNVLECVESAISAAMPQADEKQIVIERVFPHALPSARLDHARMQQVVSNLLSNAVKFSPKGSTIQVMAAVQDGELELSITDQGEGIAPEFLPYVFERFRQADASTTRRSGGLGIGLAIVRQITEMHGGRVVAESAGPGHGSRFAMYLPVADVPAEPCVPKSAAAPAVRSLEGIRVLVVEDQQDSRAMVQEVFRLCNAEVIAAASATDALAILAKFQPELIVSDIGMPEMDGYELIRAIRDVYDSRSLPAIALSAYVRPEEKNKALEAGFQVHLAKPLQASELIAAAAALAGRTDKSTDEQSPAPQLPIAVEYPSHLS